ncbi:vacuolar protein sorting [Niveomyces insectorum RCEF 264]|uniref:Probable vacuolar protein sorting-associated protein 16 homolog n=1 Tax=Niveomyces insectorum RCEF 264 TaxID=1081102 RepID=A0A167Z484_9HYPO|nr:vacuolar protein sorting [Niveomyces insectorum RCEF 264]
MDASHPTAGWEQVGDSFYRRINLYTAVFDGSIDLDNYIVAGAPYSGAIALCRDEAKIVAYQARRPPKPSVDVYSSAGRLIRRIVWDKISEVRGLGWSDDEKLLIVTRDGTVRCYVDLQADFAQFSLGHGAEEYGVNSCRFYDSGLLALLSNNALVSVTSYDEPRPKVLAACPEGKIHSWALVPPQHTLSRSVEVLLSVGQTIYVVDAAECEDRFLDAGPFTHICVSPNGKFVALYTGTGIAHVITSDFQTRLSEHRSKSKLSPKYLQWCGNDAVVIAWEDEVHVVGPGGSMAKFFYDGRIHVIQDVDGVRVLNASVCDFLQKVPGVTEEVFRFGAESPASILLDAVEQLENHSPKADDNIQLIRPNLTEAVDTCVNAAGQEFDVHWQKQLLKAASFGKSVLDIYNSDDFVDMCETLRVLNAVRFYEIGLPLSYDQYLRLGPESLIERLLNRHEYLLALRIAGYLHLPTDKIYVHWACSKVRAGSEPDEVLCQLVVDKLAGKPGISFEKIARAAYDEGRGRLATELLNHEPRAGRQVPLLLSMEEDELALDKAIESGDTDLACFVIEQLRRKLPLAAFFKTVNSRPVATALVESSAIREGDNTLLKDMYYQDDRRVSGASVFIREALRQPDNRTASDKLALAAKLLVDNQKESAFELGILKEATTLLRMQEAFDRDLTDTFTGLSVNETMFKLIRLGYHGRAKKLQSEFHVPERVAWWIRLRALVAKRDWNELEDIAKAGNTRLATTFVPKCLNLEPGAAISMYEKCGMRVKAAQEAVKAKDAEAWSRLLDAAGRGTGEGREIEQLGHGIFKK